jgi:hypothetical protein
VDIGRRLLRQALAGEGGDILLRAAHIPPIIGRLDPLFMKNVYIPIPETPNPFGLV